MAGSCEHGDEYSDFIKDGDFIPFERLPASQEGLCSAELFLVTSSSDTP
jgi:hypothetical protein